MTKSRHLSRYKIRDIPLRLGQVQDDDSEARLKPWDEAEYQKDRYDRPRIPFGDTFRYANDYHWLRTGDPETGLKEDVRLQKSTGSFPGMAWAPETYCAAPGNYW